uniref:Translation initiation factor IF-2, chloroplastic n=1 Tax=Sebdenia flabellata TaxID=42024 RepID=A0A1C9C9Q6_9FLOR|nr:translation initiation factor 2 [Sebdenia flabellata]AOM65120.1 translation initiation factor 2 [Sebdenia flabellata]
MIHKFLFKNDEFFYNHKNSKDFYRCLSIEKREKKDIFVLENPKIIYLLSSNNNEYQSIIDVDQSFSDTEEKNIDIALNTRYDKKTRSSLKQEDDLERRKTKVKFKKRIRNKISFDKEDLFIANNSNKILNNDVLDISLIKQAKYNKQKKKDKLKQMPLDDTIIEDKNHARANDIADKDIIIDNPLTIKELSVKLSIPEAEIITWLFLKGISVTINQVVDISVATEVAMHYDFKVLKSTDILSLDVKKDNIVSNSKRSIKRSPVITILGHVDHGKTTLLDAIRNTNIVKQEIGGITQSIVGYEVNWFHESCYEKLVFLDTPGHEAFTSMRLRGAQVTDIAILVVAADDGLKPQTVEAITYIKKYKLPCIVAINKIDKPNIDILRVKEELTRYDICNEAWGGTTPVIEISALTGKNIDLLLSNICVLSELQDLRADPSQLAQGTILEAYLDKTKGPVANVLIQDGTLNIGDFIMSTTTYGKVKAIINHEGLKVNRALPSSIVQVLGFSLTPEAGAGFKASYDEKQAKQIVSRNIDLSNKDNVFKSLNTRVTLDSCSKNLSVKHLNLIIKADTKGSIEAIIYAFSQIPQEKIQLNVIAASSGNISETDIELAVTSNSLFIAFNLNVSANLYNIVQKSGLVLKNFTVIYDLLDYIQDYMLDLIDPEYDKVSIGVATVDTVFYINRGCVAGCIVNSGKLQKESYISVYRNDELIYDGLLNSLKRLKDDVYEVNAGNECGVMSYEYHLWQQGDIIKAYQMIEKSKAL